MNWSVLLGSDTVSPAVSARANAGISSSCVVTDTLALATEVQSGSDAGFTTRFTSDPMSPSTVGSSTPASWTGWGVDQLAAVKVIVEESAATSELSSGRMSSTTGVRGWRSSTTVNWSTAPNSSRTMPAVSDSVNPATSSSSVVTVTTRGGIVSNAASDRVESTVSAMSVITFPSTVTSSTPETLTTWPTFQSSDVNTSESAGAPGPATVTSSVSALSSASTTSLPGSGCAVRRTSKSSEEAVSETIVLPTSVTSTPTASSSRVTARIESCRPSKASSERASSTTIRMRELTFLCSALRAR